MEGTFGSNKENEKLGDESFEDIVELKAQISKLSTENESYRQQLHDLQRKLETNVTMQSELVESNEALERSLKEHKSAINRRINEVEEKHTARRKDLEERIEEMEAQLAAKSKENRELCETIKTNNEALAALKKTQNNTIKDDDNSEFLQCQLEEVSERLTEETEICKQLKTMLESKESQCNEMREILEAAKKQQAEKDIVLEGMRDQLMTYKMELESSKSIPKSETCKGNSLFAEVEDRRKKTLEQMTAMRNGYLEAKRSFQAKEAEIRALKAERAMFLRKWEDDSVEKVQQGVRLMDKYKARITELERQLKDEKKKNAQVTKSDQLPEGSHFTYLQFLVDAKKKEVEELRTEIENNSINALLEEEAKYKMGKQVRYWRVRAMTGEAQLLSIKNRLESDPSSSNDEILETIKTLSTSMKDIDMDESAGGESSYRNGTIINETITTLDNLMTIPKQVIPPSEDSSILESVNETMDNTLRATSCESSVSSWTEWEETAEKLSTIDKSNEKPKDSEQRKVVWEETAEQLSTIDKSNEKPRDSERPKVVCTIKAENFLPEVREKENSPVNNTNTEGNSVAVTPILKSVLAKPNADFRADLSCKETNERDKKTLRFTEDTVDPPSKTLKKRTVGKPKYPIIFISSNKSKK